MLIYFITWHLSSFISERIRGVRQRQANNFPRVAEQWNEWELNPQTASSYKCAICDLWWWCKVFEKIQFFKSTSLDVSRWSWLGVVDEDCGFIRVHFHFFHSVTMLQLSQAFGVHCCSSLSPDRSHRSHQQTTSCAAVILRQTLKP